MIRKPPDKGHTIVGAHGMGEDVVQGNIVKFPSCYKVFNFVAVCDSQTFYVDY